jgi:enterochelin esterase-like enzyme
MYILLITFFLSLFNQQIPFEQFTKQLKLLPTNQRKAVVEQYLTDIRTTPIIEQDSIINFIWVGKADTVLINGDLQHGWSKPDILNKIECGEEDFFYKSFTVPPDSRLDYQFIIDGKYITDQRNPNITPSGYGPHSEVMMLKFKPTSIILYRAEIEHGTIDTMVFKSKDDSIKPRLIKIYKPAGYEKLSNLAVFFVHDGEDALNFSNYKNAIDNLIAENKIKPLIAVFIPPVDREDEYVWAKLYRFIGAMCDELVPLIDQNYHTSRKAEDRGVTGISNGGHIALATVLKRPDVFKCAAGQSSTITLHLFEMLTCSIENKKISPQHKFYFDVGRYDLDYQSAGSSFLEINREFDQTMTKNNISHIFHEFNDGHEWANWRERTEEILVYFFEKH